MVKLWLVHSGEVSLPDQIATQLHMAVLSGELPPGERLPSVRALARRFGLHHNTVSAAYRRLEQEGWVQSRRGSGVYVKERTGDAPEARALGLQSLEEAVTALVAFSRSVSVDAKQLQRMVTAAAERPRVERLLLVDPDPELREITLSELYDAKVGLAIAGCGFEEMRGLAGAGTVVLAMPSKLQRVRDELGAGIRIVGLKVSSAAGSLAAHLPKADPTAVKRVLVGLASSWPQFLEIGKTMLLAVGVEAEALVIRNARESGWTAGLEATAAVVCDCATAERLPQTVRPLVFRLVAEESIEQLRALEPAG